MKRVYDFLEKLAANNNREWFAEHRAEYDAVRAYWLEQVQILINELAKHDPALRSVSAADCVYRIYRDIRFSNNKLPFKTYFSALISPVGRHTDRACHYIHIGVEESALYSGLWNPEPKILKKVRKAIVDNVEEFRSITETPGIQKHFPGWWGRQLKTVPKGYNRDHPDADLLRLTEYGKCCELKRTFFNRKNWQKEAAQLLSLLQPMDNFLNYSIDE